MTEWQELSEEEKHQIFERLSEIYNSHSYPDWLQHPKIVQQYVNVLRENQQQIQSYIQVEGKAPLQDKTLANLLNEEISAALASVAEAQVEIGAAFGVGTPMGEIKNVN